MAAYGNSASGAPHQRQCRHPVNQDLTGSSHRPILTRYIKNAVQPKASSLPCRKRPPQNCASRTLTGVKSDRNTTADSHRWMAAAGGFLLADGQDQRAVHRECGDGGAAGWRERHDALAVPVEMLRPEVRPPVEHRKFLACVGTD